MKYRVAQYMDKIDELEQLVLLRDQLNHCIRDYKSRQKALTAEVAYGFNRTGIRGGKFTSLAAKSMKCTDSFNSSTEMAKIMSEIIFK